MADISGFDANEVEPNEGFSAIPGGDYPVIITDSKMKPTKNGNGKYLELELQILNGPHQNRKLFDRLNLVNPSDMAVKIAKGTLSAICRAVDVRTPKDSSELHNKPLTASVKTRKDPDGNMRNEVSGYKPRDTAASQQSQTEQPAAAGGEPSPF